MNSTDRLYVSTVGLGHLLDYEEVLAEYRDLGIDQVELGFLGEFEGDIDTLVEAYDFEYICHNYCLPGDGRIINLASADGDIRAWSVEYAERAIQFCATHSIDCYTVHGGFRVDPTADLEFDGPPAPYEGAFERFARSIERLGAVADRNGVVLGIENNVVETHHLDDGENTRLMFARAHEFERLLGRIDASNVGVLLDLGHLNVTAETLGFEPSEFDSLADRTVAIHVHGNDGSSDEHRPITGDDWAYLKLKDAYSLVDIPVVIESHFEDADALAESVRALRSAL